jgi:hypothetical protein
MADARGVKWYGENFKNRVDQKLVSNVSKAGDLVLKETKSLLSVPGRSIETVVTRTGRTRKKYGEKGEFVSAPGEAPRKQTGKLWRSVKKRLKRKQLKCQIVDQGRALEFGDSKMAERPHLRAALQRMKSAVIAALTQRVD